MGRVVVPQELICAVLWMSSLGVVSLQGPWLGRNTDVRGSREPSQKANRTSNECVADGIRGTGWAFNGRLSLAGSVNVIC